METDEPLDSDVALVTGASKGIGAATARRLADDGADVVLAARSEEQLADVAAGIKEDCGVRALAVPTDVREHEMVAATVDAAVEEFGRLDMLVNNAGVTGEEYDERMEEISVGSFRQVTDVNICGTFYATRAALPHLRETNGTLVFVGSSAGKLPRPGAPVYAASKWWMRGFALSVQAHAGQSGVAVSLVNPTAVRTRLWDDLGRGEAAEPEEVAEIIATAARQPAHSTLSEVDLFRRDMLGKFIPADIDLSRAFDPVEDEQ